MSYFHGIKSKQSQAGARAIKDVATSLICILGTAPDADAEKYPIGQPVLISAASNQAYDALGKSGTLARALDGIRDQIGANVVIIRLEADDDANKQTSIVHEGVQLLRGVESVVGEKPKILIAPGFMTLATAEINPIVAEMLSVAEGLRALVIADGPNTQTTDSITARKHYGSKRLVIVDPGVKVWDSESDGYVDDYASSRIAGLFARNDSERSAFHAPSNMLLKGIGGTSRPIQHATSDDNSEHNLLNKEQIGTIVNSGGYRFLGTDTCDTVDSNNRFINAVRGGDAIDDALEAGILWALDRNITKTFVEDVTATIQGFIDNKIAQGDLLPGSVVMADPELNNPTAYAQGQVYFNYDYAIPTPAVAITVTRKVNYDFAKGVFN